MQTRASRVAAVTDAASGDTVRIAWRPIDERGWPGWMWHACDTWIGDHRVFARISPEGDEGRPPLVMLHGAVVAGDYFGPIAWRLNNSCRVYIPDLPGFGRSAASHILTLPEQVDVLDRWMKVHQVSGAVVVANSTGCQVATMLATRHPDRVSRLVLVAPTMDPSIRGLLGLMWRGLLDIPRERQRLWTIWLSDLWASGVVRAIRCVTDAIRDDQAGRLPRLRQPTICVGGERDPICPPRWVESLASCLPDAKTVILPGAPHAMNFSAPDALADVIRSMMDNTGSNESWQKSTPGLARQEPAIDGVILEAR